MISGNMVGSYSQMGKTFILVDESGTEITGVVTENVQAFDATAADVKIGKTFVSDDGCLEGTDTKTYRVKFATYLIFPNENFSIPLQQYDAYDYTDFNAMISVFNTTKFDSTSIEKIVIFDSVYNTGSNNSLSDVSKDKDTKSINLNIVNNTNNIYIVHYSTYREEY